MLQTAAGGDDVGDLNERLAGVRGQARKAAAVAAVLLAGLLAAGCAGQAAGRPQASVPACTRFSVNAMQRHLTVTTLPAACRGLTRAGLSDAVNAAADELASSGALHGKTLMRARKRELSPLLPRLTHLAEPHGPLPSAGTLAGGPSPGLLALGCWLVTVVLGLYLTVRWIVRGGLRRSGRRFVRRPVMNLTHLGLAVAGLAVWISYLLTGVAGLAWLACVLLLPVTGLGMSLLVLRLPGPARAAAAAPAAVSVPVPAAAAPAGTRLLAGLTRPAAASPAAARAAAARRLTPLIVAAHIVFSVATMMFALLAAISAG